MMNFYRFLSFLLIPVGVFFAFITLFGLLLALGNLSVLLSVFMTGATTIYIFTSFSFLNKSLVNRRPSAARLFDWIRVNGFVAGIFSTLLIVQGLMFFLNPQLQQMLLDQMKSMQVADLSESLIIKTLKVILTLFVIIGAAILVHVMLTFRLIKKHREMFQ